MVARSPYPVCPENWTGIDLSGRNFIMTGRAAGIGLGSQSNSHDSGVSALLAHLNSIDVGTRLGFYDPEGLI